MTQPHPQRCETCMVAGCNERTNTTVDFISEIRKQNIIQEFIEKHGCASHSSATEPEKIPDSATLIEMAETEWHNREERFGLHDKIPWTTGWMSGFLTPNKPDWSKDHDAFIAQAEREKVLDEALAEFQNINAPPVRVTYIRHVLESLRQHEGKP